MAGSRTIKTLTALLVAMTLGSFLMMLMETDPIRPGSPLAGITAGADDSAKVIRDTRVPRRNTWRNIIIHSSAAEGADIQKRCHFVIDAAGVLTRTALWAGQADGNHVNVYGGDWNSDSIGVVVVTDGARRELTPQQAAVLQNLTSNLQRMLGIPDARVYRHGQLPGSPAACGEF